MTQQPTNLNRRKRLDNLEEARYKVLRERGCASEELMKQITSLLFGLALLASGCSSLRPPAQDKLAWEGQQSEGEKMSPQEEANWNLLYDVVSCVGGVVH